MYQKHQDMMLLFTYKEVIIMNIELLFILLLVFSHILAAFIAIIVDSKLRKNEEIYEKS